ncbi:MAG: hypothetical protein JXR46_09735 [Calditrichaceae bacterium]|nr:hypothetical protein [Calditrichaceae bacterium]MBN2709314.1 hypothetical protein [Calditrichaceae bacterium]RQV94650.1 MAG: hypothetical protein EH224_09515 [Calditrichota bacterium]
MKIKFIILFNFVIFISSYSYAQYVLFDSTKNYYQLNYGLKLYGNNQKSLLEDLRKAIDYYNKKSIIDLIKADERNLKTLILISQDAHSISNYLDENASNYSTFKGVLNDVLSTDDYRKKSFIAHFQVLYDLNDDAIDFITKYYDSEYMTWFPIYLDAYQEYLLLFRNNLKNYFPKAEQDLNQSWIDFLFFLDMRFNDASILEIKNITYDLDAISQIIHNPNANLVNISNSKIKIIASSVLGKKYDSSNLLDYDLNSIWAEGVEGDGSGEMLKINLEKKVYIKNLILFPGHSKNEKLFFENNRLKEIEIMINGIQSNVIIDDVFVPVSIPIEKTTSDITIRILSVYKGSKYNDLCVGEIMLTKK